MFEWREKLIYIDKWKKYQTKKSSHKLEIKTIPYESLIIENADKKSNQYKLKRQTNLYDDNLGSNPRSEYLWVVLQ